MKNYAITFSTLVDALKHQWKKVVLMTALFAVLGMISGVFFADKGTSATIGSAEALELVSFFQIPKADNYYSACYSTLQTAYSQTNTYVKTLAEDRSLSPAQSAALQKELLALNDFFQMYMDPLELMWIEPGAIFFPVDLLDRQLTLNQQKLTEIQIDLISAKAAYDLLQNMDAPKIATDEIAGSYSTILSESQNYGNLLREKKRYEQLVFQLENERDAVAAHICQFDEQLQGALTELTALQQAISSVADDICAENALLLKLDSENIGTFNPAVHHGHTEASHSDAVAIIVLFCTLVGLCSGCFLALWVDVRRKEIAGV